MAGKPPTRMREHVRPSGGGWPLHLRQVGEACPSLTANAAAAAAASAAVLEIVRDKNCAEREAEYGPATG